MRSVSKMQVSFSWSVAQSHTRVWNIAKWFACEIHGKCAFPLADDTLQ